ncbi:MAG TPA: hypothetical protein VHS96_04615, partial [Bacteroidia bacterium]|nr:hypothetical protein [Bacteroidia bacterium]
TKPKMTLARGEVSPNQFDRGELQKYFETELFGGKASGWLVIAEVEVLASNNGVVDFKVLKVKSELTVNGQPKSHFVAGKRVKFVEFEYAKETIQRNSGYGGTEEGPAVCGKKVGTWTRYYPDKKVHEIIRYDQDGIKNGLYEAFYERNGARKLLGDYVKNEQSGEWKQYFENGELKIRENYVTGKNVGLYQEWHPNGKLKAEGNFDRYGRWTGEWKVYREDGTISRQMVFGETDYPKATATFKEFDEQGKLKGDGYLNAKSEMQGPCSTYYDTGRIASIAVYESGVKWGKYASFFPNGNLHEGGIYVKDSLKAGIWKVYYEDGKQHSEIAYCEDAPQRPGITYCETTHCGVWKVWHPNGNLEQDGEFTASGKMKGIWRTYAENGTPLSTYSYIEGKLEGQYRKWYADGKLAEYGEYNGNEDLTGDFASFYPNGRLKEGGAYVNGERTGKWVTRDATGKKRIVKY